MEESVFVSAEAFLTGLFAGDSGGHDIHHTLRVHDLARSICHAEGGDEDVVRLAALMHDADDPKLFSSTGFPNARRFMESQGVSRDIQDRVVEIIGQVSFKGTSSVVPDSIEGRIVQDADRLDAMGAIGIARAFAYGGSKGRQMHMPGAVPNMGMDEAEYRRNKGTTINHFHEKLLLLKDMMGTDTGRRMAEHRHRYMEEFLKEFHAEWEGRLRSFYYEMILGKFNQSLFPHPA